jgi:hypothetical protein
MKKIIAIIILSIYLTFSNNTYALETNSSLIKAYNSFIVKLERTFDTDKQLIILEKVKTKLDLIFKTKKLSTKSIMLLKELNNLNNLKIEELNKKVSNNNYIDLEQIELEKQEIKKFLNQKNPILPNYISKILSDNAIFLSTIYNETNFIYEFYENNKIN